MFDLLYQFAVIALISFAAGCFIGHPIGYDRGRRSASPRRQRVGAPE